MPTSHEHRKRMLQHLEEQQRQRAVMKAWHSNLPCKNEGAAEVNGGDGSCLRCGAAQGEACL